MKRYFFTFLLWAILFSLMFSSPLAKEETQELPTKVTPTDLHQSIWAKTVAEALSQVKGRCEIWIPLLPEGHEVTEITVTPNGSYYFTLKKDIANGKTLEKIAVIHNTPKTAPRDNLSFYEYMLGEKAFAITPQTVDQIPRANHKMENQTTAYSFQVLDAVYTTFLSRPSLCLFYNYEHKSLGVDDFGTFGTLSETVVELNSQQVLSAWIYPTGSCELPLTVTTFGDGDTDGFVNAKDALLVLKHSVNKAKIEDPNAFYLCDFDQTQTLTANDALYILKKAVGKL